MSKEVIITGVRANDEPHIGNYLGAIFPMIDMANKHANEYQINMFVPDLHSITVPVDHSILQKNVMYNLKLYIASGLQIENDNVYMYRQSYIPAHSEMAWILSCFTGFGEAQRMVEFKDKSEKIGKDRVSVGLLDYPILMAGDIFLYDAVWVPIGEDQRQHLELARDLASRINNKFGEILKVPNEIKKQQEFIDRDSAPRVRSLKDPSRKMSKSVSDPNGTILLSDSPTDAAKKIMSATTDSVGVINYDWEKQPGITNLLQMLALLSAKSQDEVNKQWTGKTSYGELKQTVADEVSKTLETLQSKLAEVDEAKLIAKLEQSELAMNKVANSTLLKVQKAVGLR